MKEDDKFDIDDFILDESFLWSIMTLVACCIGVAVCSVAALIYVLFFN